MSREYPEWPVVGVGVVVLGAEGVLMIRRGNPPRQGQWSLPGGAQKLGETVFDTARRETREETGLDIDVLGLVDVVDSIQADDDGKVRYHFTLVDVFAVVRQGPGRLSAGGDAGFHHLEPTGPVIKEGRNRLILEELVKVFRIGRIVRVVRVPQPPTVHPMPAAFSPPAIEDR